jgi:hypothetical protein
VVQVSDGDALIMSLAENITCRQFRPMELLQAIERLRASGYLNKLLANEAISRYLLRHYPELLDEFRFISELEALEV